MARGLLKLRGFQKVKAMLLRNLIASVGVLMLAATAAMAATETIDGSYSLSYTPTLGNGPTLTDSLSNPFSENLTVNSPTPITNFFSVSPAGSSGDATYHNAGTATGTITVTFNFSSPTGPSVSDTAQYMANYNVTDVGGVWKQSDSVDWTGSGTGPGGSAPLEVTFGNGSVLDIDLYNASDWTIVPKISFDLKNGPTQVPESASIALFVSGLLGLGILAYRRRRRGLSVQI